MRRSLAVLVAVAAAVTLWRPAAAGSYVYWYDQNANGIADTWLYDDDGDTSFAERMLVDANENGRIEMQAVYATTTRIASVWLDPGEDGGYEIMAQPAYGANGALLGRYLWYDPNLDGRFELGYYDGNLDGYYEWVCVDPNYDGVADRWVGNTAPAGRSATDDIARRIAAANWVTAMHSRGLAVFFPTVSVPLP